MTGLIKSFIIKKYISHFIKILRKFRVIAIGMKNPIRQAKRFDFHSIRHEYKKLMAGSLIMV